MAVGDFPPMGGSHHSQPCTLLHSSCASDILHSGFRLAPETALFLAIDLHCFLQTMARGARAPVSEDDEVTYYVNRDFAGWVEQRVRRRAYVELKLELTRNRSRDVQKARDDWLCLYCRGYFPSKLRLTDHRVVGCPCGHVDSTGSKWELPVYPNLKTAKQGKDLKLALQRGVGSVWDSLQDETIWLDLNPELREVTYSPPGARVQQRRFMEQTLENLTPCPTPATDSRPQGTPTPHRPPRQQPSQPAFVVLEDDGDDDPEAIPSRPKKRSHADMADGHRVHHSSRQFRDLHRRPTPMPRGPNKSVERQPPLPQRSSPRK